MGEFYQTHFDSEPEQAQNVVSGGCGQGVRRAVTVLIYLDPPEARDKDL